MIGAQAVQLGFPGRLGLENFAGIPFFMFFTRYLAMAFKKSVLSPGLIPYILNSFFLLMIPKSAH